MTTPDIATTLKLELLDKAVRSTAVHRILSHCQAQSLLSLGVRPDRVEGKGGADVPQLDRPVVGCGRKDIRVVGPFD